MRNKTFFIFIVAILAVIAAAGAIWYYYYYKPQPTPPTPSEQEQVPPTLSEEPEDTLLRSQKHQQTIETNKKVVYESEKVANPLLVGQWLEDGTQHYRVYLDDACDEESYFWGKEWDEAQGVFEEDLTYHGNGWFKWSKKHNELTEIYVSEQGIILVPYEYRIDQLDDTAFVYTSFRVTQDGQHQQKKVAFRVHNFHRL